MPEPPETVPVIEPRVSAIQVPAEMLSEIIEPWRKLESLVSPNALLFQGHDEIFIDGIDTLLVAGLKRQQRPTAYSAYVTNRVPMKFEDSPAVLLGILVVNRVCSPQTLEDARVKALTFANQRLAAFERAPTQLPL